MPMMPFLLWGVGLLLIFLEFYLPGAVLGVSGGLLILSGVVLFAYETGSPLATILYVISAITSIGALIKFSLWRIRSTKPDYSIYSDANQEGYVASKFDKTKIGKVGIVLSDLKPGGYILIEGKQYQAISQTGYIVKGSSVKVLGGQEESLLVKPMPS
jgi:membrane-bound ClpP family serine protease